MPEATGGGNSTECVMCGSRVGMVQHSSWLYRCLILISCKLSDPFRLIPDGLREGGIQSTTNTYSEEIQLIAWALQIELYERSNGGVKKTLKPSGSIGFLYLNARCCETKWYPSVSSNVNTLAKALNGPLVSGERPTLWQKCPQINRLIYIKPSVGVDSCGWIN